MSREPDAQLSQLIKDYWKDYAKHYSELDFVIKPSIPIIWFGDLNEYLKPDNFKVVTVAVNPSDMEFKKKATDEPDVNVRFPGANSLLDKFSDNKNTVEEKIEFDEITTLWDAYNSYFHTDKEPYKKWFNCFERLFAFLPRPVSYYPNQPNRASHIDCRTAIATSKWTDLTKDQRNSITNKDLFIRLLNYLKPNIVLFSTEKNIYDEITAGGKTIFELPKKRNGIPAISRLLDDNMLFIYLKNSKLGPASGVSPADREVFFREVFKNYSCK